MKGSDGRMKARSNDAGKIVLVQTARDTGDRLTRKEDVFFRPDDRGLEHKLINIHDNVLYQEIEGFGGAFTEAAASTFYKMSVGKRREILKAYFDVQTGLGYNLCRTHINSCDFSLGNYAYDEVEGDVELKHFSIKRDREYLLPFIKEAIKAGDGSLKLFASPWSPPAWMKTTGEMNHGGKLKEEYRRLWAQYLARYIKEYAAEGVGIWGVTVQNEPKAVQVWDSCIYSAEEERDFIRDHLGPVFVEEKLGDVHILFWDHNKERVYERARLILSDPEAAKYIWGIGFHWYSGDHFEGLTLAHEAYPGLKMLFTEGCVERGVHLGSWDTGERYGHDIIGNLNNWTVGWTDWNLLLDETGGPNHVGNYCDAPVIADTRTDTVTYESSYYYIGHFSRYIRPGARCLGFSRYTDRLEVTAFKNPGGEIVTVVMNRSGDTLEFNLRCGRGTANMESLPHSIMTLVYRI